MRKVIKFVPLVIGALGLAAAAMLIIYQGPELIFKTFATAGWGVVLVAILHFPHMLIAGRGWQILWPKNRRWSIWLFTWALWVREAVNSLLPVARIGGEVAALSILRRHGMPLSSSVGSLVVETTLSVVTTFIFVLTGVFLLSLEVPGYGQWLQWGIGLGVAFLVFAGLITLQRIGAFRLASKLINFLGGGELDHLITSGARLDRAVRAFYGRPWRVFMCGWWSFLSWFVGAFEFWLALHFLNHPAPFTHALILEAMIHATGSAAFFVPASLGIQEGALLFFGNLLGISGDTALALALVRRCRDVLVMAPGLIIWQVQEGSFFLSRFLKGGKLPKKSADGV